MIGNFISLALFQAVADSEVPDDLDLTKFRDIKPHQSIPGATPETFSSILVVVLIGIAIASFSAIVLWYIYRRRVDGSLLAMAEIDRLESTYSANPSEAYDQLAALVRQLISSRNSDNIMAKTTDQVIDSLRSSNSPSLMATQVGMLLRLADQTKFAGGTADSAMPDESVFDLTRAIVQTDASRMVVDAEGDE